MRIYKINSRVKQKPPPFQSWTKPYQFIEKATERYVLMQVSDPVNEDSIVVGVWEYPLNRQTTFLWIAAIFDQISLLCCHLFDEAEDMRIASHQEITQTEGISDGIPADSKTTEWKNKAKANCFFLLIHYVSALCILFGALLLEIQTFILLFSIFAKAFQRISKLYETNVNKLLTFQLFTTNDKWTISKRNEYVTTMIHLLRPPNGALIYKPGFQFALKISLKTGQ